MRNEEGISRFVVPALMAAVSIATLSVFAVFNLSNPAGNQFTSSLPRQLLLYGRLAGILCALLFLFQFIQMNRKRAGGDPEVKARMSKTHTVIGFFILGFLMLHVLLIFFGRSRLSGEPFRVEFSRFVLDGGWGSLALFGVLLLLLVLVCCWLMLSGKIPLAFWRKTHYLIYLAIIPILAHQIFCGCDFISNWVFQIFWLLLFVLVLGNVILRRIIR